jgi:starvation-inducible DNA-binding protein
VDVLERELRVERIIEDHRRGIAELDDLDLVSQDVLVTQTERLELFHWFVRAHLAD